MSEANGRNPLRYDCKQRGACYNRVHRPKIEEFARFLPGKIAFGDVDGIVEISGNALMIEWKSAPMALNAGQSIMYKRITNGKRFTVLCVAGNAETMEVTHRQIYFDGKEPKEWTQSSFDDIGALIKRWSEWAKTNRRIA